MSDVFLSYAPEDRPAARVIAEALERRGHDVAWDWEQYSGDEAADVTEQALEEARAVVVLWSGASAGAGWVEPEAIEGLRGGRLVVARLEDAKLPRRVRKATDVDLTAWDRSRVAAEVDALAAAVGGIVAATPERAAAPAPAAAPRASRLDVPSLLAASPVALQRHDGEVYDLAWSADGAMIASASADRTAVVWRLPGGKRIARLVGHRDEVNDVALSPDGSIAATASDDGTVCLWDVAKESLQRRIDLDGSPVYSVASSPDGRLVAAGTSEGLLIVAGAADGRERWRVSHDAGLSTARFFPDGTLVVTGDDSGRVVLRDAGDGEALLAFDAHDDEVTTLAVAPVGNLVATTSEHGGLGVWQIPERTMQWWQSEPAGMIYGTAFSPAGEVLASTDDAGITIWQALDGEPIGQFADPDSTRLEFSPSGTALAWASGNTVRVLTV